MTEVRHGGTTNGAAANGGPNAALAGTAELPVLTRKDFVSDQEVRWCPGCWARAR